MDRVIDAAVRCTPRKRIVLGPAPGRSCLVRNAPRVAARNTHLEMGLSAGPPKNPSSEPTSPRSVHRRPPLGRTCGAQSPRDTDPPGGTYDDVRHLTAAPYLAPGEPLFRQTSSHTPTKSTAAVWGEWRAAIPLANGSTPAMQEPVAVFRAPRFAEHEFELSETRRFVIPEIASMAPLQLPVASGCC